MEIDILSAILSSREAHDKIVEFINPKSYTREFQHLLKFINDYYHRDSSIQSVNSDLLSEQIKASIENDKHVERFVGLVHQALNHQTSVANTEAVVLLAKQREVEIELASKLAEGNKDVDELIESYQRLKKATVLDDLTVDDGTKALEVIDVVDLLSARMDRKNLFPLYPRAINDRLDGGCEAGDVITVFGMTEIGKSMIAIHNSCGWANSGKRVLYLINEDRKERIALRIASNLTGMTRPEMEREQEKAAQLARDRGISNVTVVQITPGTLPLIEKLIEDYEPDAVVLDQLRNVNTGTRNNRVVQLEEVATGMRNIGKKYGVLVMDVTQAAESARNKVFLDTGDVDYSNVGIPAQADILLGFGADEAMVKNNERGISLCKNKISGDHAQLIVRVNPFLSRVMSL